jgi:hypothetical protein
MAEQRKSGRGKGGIDHHPLVEALASDPSQPPQPAAKLFGFPGPAAEADSTRLWLDLDLTSYVDVPDDAIVHHHNLENHGGTILWVEPSAKLSHSTTRSQEVEAEFLGGPISQANLAAAAGAGRQVMEPIQTIAERQELQPQTLVWGSCVDTAFTRCGHSAFFPCVTSPRFCRPASIGCPSRAIPCPPESDFRCPTGWRCQTPGCADTPLCGDPLVDPGGDPVGPFRAAGGFR